ncbi:diacylglycerol/lipid kinase family protein [Tenacibaculum sp. ZS6-P6]|uniref:diacylglycerol/lipid kinase family protein n=1 Tax=Tenacibaculum sp. ZS6-P6 TaxID=3447503 RepID=UPI003F9D9DCF
MNTCWFVIINPTAGNTSLSSILGEIKYHLNNNNIKYSYALTTHEKHEIELVHEAINNGIKKFISVGGDGTLHNIVNGIMTQNKVSSNEITVGVIPLGTGNDWVKTYKIPQKISKNIEIIKSEKTVCQDIGYLKLKNNSTYFNNVAGIGYDGYVVNKLKKLKKLGSIAYLISGLYGLLFYKKTSFTIQVNNEIIKTKCLMTLFGICKYSAGGMQLTNYKNSSNGFLDITIAKNLTFKDLILNIKKLYNGQIINHNKVETFLSDQITIVPDLSTSNIYIQADGELIGTGPVTVQIIKKAINFVVNT